MIGVDEIASRNKLRLYRTRQPGQWKAHCPVCNDHGQNFHLYVNSQRDTFYCHKCGNKGGAIAFHAFLSGLSFTEAKDELYPPEKRRRRGPKHPAEDLTWEQLHLLGFTRKPSPIPPKTVDPKQWKQRRWSELNWIWREWKEYQRISAQIDQVQEKMLRELEANTAQQIG